MLKNNINRLFYGHIMTKMEEIIKYLETNGFRCITSPDSDVRVYLHEDKTVVKVKRLNR